MNVVSCCLLLLALLLAVAGAAVVVCFYPSTHTMGKNLTNTAIFKGNS
jgi:hypothetical protein